MVRRKWERKEEFKGRGAVEGERERVLEGKVKFPFLISHGVQITCIALKVFSGILIFPSI